MIGIRARTFTKEQKNKGTPILKRVPRSTTHDKREREMKGTNEYPHNEGVEGNNRDG